MKSERDILTESESRLGRPAHRRDIAHCSAQRLEVGSERAHWHSVNLNRVERVERDD
jgi:hypothetical protein